MSKGNAKVKGSRYERELANRLWRMGFAVLRGCASGSGVKKRFVPDIVAIGPGFVLILEVKYRSRPTQITIEEEKVERLLEFARRCNGIVYIAVKYSGDDWKFVEVKGKGRIVIKPDSLQGALTLRDLEARFRNASIVDFLR